MNYECQLSFKFKCTDVNTSSPKITIQNIIAILLLLYVKYKSRHLNVDSELKPVIIKTSEETI